MSLESSFLILLCLSNVSVLRTWLQPVHRETETVSRRELAPASERGERKEWAERIEGRGCPELENY